MRILVDCRHLNQKSVSGIGEYTIQLLHALFALNASETSGQNSYVLLTSGRIQPDILALFRERSSPTIVFPPFVTHRHISISNKLLNLKIMIMKNPSLNWLVPDAVDLIFKPNLNITVLPKDIPTILTIHDLSWKFFPEFYSWKMRLWHHVLQPKKLIDASRMIIAPSTSTKRDTERTFQKSSEMVTAIPHGIHSSFHPQMEARDHGVRSRLKLPKRFVLFVGTIEPRKNVLSLIEGMKIYREKSHDDIHLLLVGKWGWKSHNIRRRIWRRDVCEWVHELGYVQAIDRPAIYRSATVFAWPSFYEGFGLPILEAMASGLPVLTSHTSSMPELTGTAAVHIDPSNVQDIADAISGIITSRPLQDQLRRAGIEQAKKYTWEETAKKMLNQFEHLTKK